MQIEELLGRFEEIITRSTDTYYRPALDQQRTLVDLSYDTIKLSMRSYKGDFNALYSAYIESIKALITPSRIIHLDQVHETATDKLYKYTYLVEINSKNYVMIGPSFGAIQNIVSKASKHQKFKNFWGSPLGSSAKRGSSGRGYDNRITRTNVGHIGGTDQYTPLGEKLEDIGEEFINFLSPKGQAVLSPLLEKAKRELAVSHAEVYLSMQNTMGSLENVFTKLLEGTVVVTVQTHKYNNKLSQEERAIIKSISEDMRKEIIKHGANLAGSPTIKQEIKELIVSNIKGTIPKKSTHSKKQRTKKRDTKGRSDTKGIVALQPFRQEGKFVAISEVNLQAILNKQLATQIQENMGTGDSSSILNYRTGRFAESAKVERISISREGMITAFYTYMKYPYQTFEPGFRQGEPSSRNPRLLISKSIREIAAPMVANRLRAVLV